MHPLIQPLVEEYESVGIQIRAGIADRDSWFHTLDGSCIHSNGEDCPDLPSLCEWLESLGHGSHPAGPVYVVGTVCIDER